MCDFCPVTEDGEIPLHAVTAPGHAHAPGRQQHAGTDPVWLLPLNSETDMVVVTRLQKNS